MISPFYENSYHLIFPSPALAFSSSRRSPGGATETLLFANIPLEWMPLQHNSFPLQFFKGDVFLAYGRRMRENFLEIVRFSFPWDPWRAKKKGPLLILWMGEVIPRISLTSLLSPVFSSCFFDGKEPFFFRSPLRVQ